MGLITFSNTSIRLCASVISISYGDRFWSVGCIMKEFFPSFANSGTQPSGNEKLILPFIAADIPLVPDASRYMRGLLSHTSDPFLSILDSPNSYPVNTAQLAKGHILWMIWLNWL